MTQKICVLMAETYLGERPSDDAEVCHGPLGNACDSLDNLAWGDRSLNMLHRRRDGTIPKMKRKVTAEIADEIREMIAAGVSQGAVAAHLEISPATVRYWL